MAKQKTKDYIDELRGLIEKRNEGGFDPWLMPMLRSTAMNMVILDRLQEELEKSNMTDYMDGSMVLQVAPAPGLSTLLNPVVFGVPVFGTAAPGFRQAVLKGLEGAIGHFPQVGFIELAIVHAGQGLQGIGSRRYET